MLLRGGSFCLELKNINLFYLDYPKLVNVKKQILNIIYKAIAVIMVMPLYHVKSFLIRKSKKQKA